MDPLARRACLKANKPVCLTSIPEMREVTGGSLCFREEKREKKKKKKSDEMPDKR